jgi:long-chain acyl-CoA synthetase
VLTLPNLLRATALTHGARVAIRDQAGELNWEEYVARIARTAGMLRSLGLKPGERFAILCRNCVLQAQLLYAGYWSGVVPVPLNFRLSTSEIAQLLEDADCGILLIDNAFADLLEQPALARWKTHAIVIPLDGSGGNLPTIEAPLARATPIAALDVDEDDDAILLYTGGTTGRGKGVRLTHRNVVSNALQLSRVMSVRESDIYLHVSPMFHSTDLKATVVSMFGGGHVYLKEFSVTGLLEAVERDRVTIISIVPTMIVRILREARLDRYDLSSLRLISYGTSPIDEGTLRQAMEAFPEVGFHQCYGLTETSPLLAILDEDAHRRALDSRPELLRAAGRLLPSVDLRFVTDDGRDLARGEIGEIVVRGPQVAKGYLNRPAENASAFRDGWFHTGDIGRLDEEGYLHVLDRKKEMVITGGENVYTREVENVLHKHPDIAEVAVVGVPDEKYGEALLAVIVPESDRAGARSALPSADALIDFCRGELGGYKIPRQFMFVEQLPRTPLGKVRKYELVTKYLAGLNPGRE